jgi:hypothetical protein
MTTISSIKAPTSDRAAAIQQAFVIEYITIAWMVVEAAVAIGSDVAANSLTLIAFGVDSIIELASAVVLVGRLTVELRRGEAFAESADRIASRVGGALLFALGGRVAARCVGTTADAIGDDVPKPHSRGRSLRKVIAFSRNRPGLSAGAIGWGARTASRRYSRVC